MGIGQCGEEEGLWDITENNMATLDSLWVCGREFEIKKLSSLLTWSHTHSAIG